ncbi:hypothetical protein XELAEV_18044269mg [Xenopus laevis]|uniref:Uncharacterized protein n=1 Tax=Xenopus laevis TaxID=8355 RepID=A0A974BYQ4_XENLA|nr:hypothetical protein XELAEV_18044269mg [Xenopus laevis]
MSPVICLLTCRIFHMEIVGPSRFLSCLAVNGLTMPVGVSANPLLLKTVYQNLGYICWCHRTLSLGTSPSGNMDAIFKLTGLIRIEVTGQLHGADARCTKSQDIGRLWGKLFGYDIRATMNYHAPIATLEHSYRAGDVGEYLL